MDYFNKNLFSTIEQIANLGIYEVDLRTGLWKGSENFIRIFGLPKKKQYTQEEFQKLVHPKDFEDVMANFERCLKEKRDFDIEYRCITPYGKLIHVSSKSKIYFDEKGNPLKVIGIKQDITEQKSFELKLADLNKRLQNKDRILGEVAHDLRAPLSHIIAISMLLEDKLDEEQSQLFNLLISTCDTTDHLIAELIEISELETTPKKLKTSKTNINELIEESIQRHKFKLQEKQLNLKQDLDPKAIAHVNREKFSRVIDNLLSNAIKFTHKDHSIEFVTEIDDGQVILQVKDEGIGIKKDHLPHIFENPHSIRRLGTDGEESTGFGLSIVKQIVDLHRGKITVNSTLGEGTTFTVKLDHFDSQSVSV